MKDKLLQAFEHLLNSIIDLVPKVIVALALAIIALFLAKLAEVSLRFVLTRLRFDALVQRAGIDKALARIGLRRQLNLFLPRLAYFLVLLLLVKTATDALGLVAISSAVDAFFSYLPNVVAALLLLLLGTSFGQFASQTVEGAAANAGIDFAHSLGRLVAGLILFVVTIMAIAELKIDTQIVKTVTSFLLGGVALAFGLSFGLGTRDVIRNVSAGFYARKLFQVGRYLEISGASGQLAAITPTHVILQTDTGKVSIANAVLLEQIAKHG